MGDIADMIVEGMMCPCGEFIGDASGYPRFCSDQCAKDYGGGSDEPANTPKDPKTVLCPSHPSCERRFRTREGAAQHWVDAHG